MFARTTILQLKPETVEQALAFIRQRMIPSASTQQGFEGAFLMQHTEDATKYIIISLWTTREDLLASHPPADLLPELEVYGEQLADSQQGVYRMLLNLEKPDQRKHTSPVASDLSDKRNGSDSFAP